MTKMNLHIAHQVPGRVRMKIPAGKGNAELLQQISEVFRVIPGIEEITVNPATGSVVLHYDADRHDEFHGTFQQHYSAHSAADGNGAAPGGMHGADTELDKLTNSIEAEAEFLAIIRTARAPWSTSSRRSIANQDGDRQHDRSENPVRRQHHRLHGLRGGGYCGYACLGDARDFHRQSFH